MLKDYEIQEIRDTYKRLGTIRATAKATRHAEGTIRDYVQYMKPNRDYLKKPVYMLDPWTGEIILKFDSMKQAGDYFYTTGGVISGAATGPCKTACGFAWCKVSEYDTFTIPEYTKPEKAKIMSREDIEKWKEGRLKK
jgi:hypothetical protein